MKTEPPQIVLLLLLLLFWTRSEKSHHAYVHAMLRLIGTARGALDDQQLLAIEGSKKVAATWALNVQPHGVRKTSLKKGKKHPPPPPYEHLVASAIGVDLKIGAHRHLGNM